jgi:acetoin utilization deacetylase AcuC-like enzyme
MFIMVMVPRKVFTPTLPCFSAVFTKVRSTRERERAGQGANLNLTVPAGTTGDTYKKLMDEKVIPAMEGFKPELILVSAGYDAHRRDPLAGVRLEDEDFGMLTRQVLDAANTLCCGKVVAVLEGGYDLQGLSGGVEHTLRQLIAN